MLETSIKPYWLFSHIHTLERFTIIQQYESSNKYEYHNKNADMDYKTSKKTAFKMYSETAFLASSLASILVLHVLHLTCWTHSLAMNSLNKRMYVAVSKSSFLFDGVICRVLRLFLLSIWSHIRLAFACLSSIRRNFKQRMHSGGTANRTKNSQEIHHLTPQ